MFHDNHPSLIIPQTCPICLETFKNGTEISFSKNFECVHVFHRLCIADWLLRNDDHLCPMCRCNFLKEKKEEERVDVSPLQISMNTNE